MIELLAHVDPFAGLMACLWLFAAGMFPAGFMLGATCSACCNNQAPCSQCAAGELPDTITLTFSEGFSTTCFGDMGGAVVSLSRSLENPCVWEKGICGIGYSVAYNGPASPPVVSMTTLCIGNFSLYEFTSTSNVENCSELAFTAEDGNGASVQVAPGGIPQDKSCEDCAGHVTVNGVAVPVVPIGILPSANVPYTIVCVNPQLPCDSTDGVVNDSQFTSAYVWARAVVQCRVGDVGLGEVRLSVKLGLVGIIQWSNLCENLDDELTYKHLSAGQVYDGNAWGNDAPTSHIPGDYNIILNSVSSIHSYGQIVGDSCGTGWSLSSATSNLAFDCAMSCMELMDADSRSIATDNLACGG